jgi:primosomal protein N' (replication factor Y)
MENLFGQPEKDASTGKTYRQYAQVAPERGLDRPEGLTYGVPDDMEDLAPGDRVVIPLGRGSRTVTGHVLRLASNTDIPASKIKPIAARERQSLRLPDELIDLARWISDYYCCPLGMVFATMLPAAVKKGTGLVKRRLVDLNDPIAPGSLSSIVKHHKLPAKQSAILGQAMELKTLGKLPIDARDLAEMAGAKTTGPVRQLVDKGLLAWADRTEIRALWSAVRPEQPATVQLNSDQRQAVQQIVNSLGRFDAHLLHGVTGSGKTEVYMRVIERVLAAEQSAIVLVPEISLTPQAVGRFTARFERVAVLHSGLTAAQRHEQWLSIHDGHARVIVGARSAVFAPVGQLGLIIVDEEADPSYKQDQLPRYHARDVAVRRAQMKQVPVVLGSATPSLESYHNATTRKSYHLIELPHRVLDLPMPTVEVVDLMADRRKRYAWQGKAGVNLLSMRLETALRQTFESGGQALLLLNRRGFANYIACPDQNCGWTMRCDHCDVNMVYHLDKRLPTGGFLRCHYCTFENRLPKACPLCQKKLTVFGLGTQRVETELSRKFPEVPTLRMDSDAMRTAEDYRRTLEAFGRGEVQLLVGTQMIAKGLDFPNVRLVGVISADTALNLPDFRSAERTFMLIAQVAGRSGRSAGGGRVIVQTFVPDHPAVQFAMQHDYHGFAEEELANRRMMNLPPISRMARIVVRDHELPAAQELARRTAELLEGHNQQHRLGATIQGPFPPPIARIGDYHRQQIEITAANATHLQRLLGLARQAGVIRSDITMAVDVDPVSLL